MGLRAADQLVAELAANRVGNDLKPTEEQRELNIPRFLVYLLGIAIAEDEYQQNGNEKPPGRNPPAADEKNRSPSHPRPHCFSHAREKRFAALQKQYWAALNCPGAGAPSAEQASWMASSLTSEPYRLTARVHPSNKQNEIVRRDLWRECEKLESLSRAALESLLREEESRASARNNKPAGGKKQRKNKQNKHQPQPAASKKEDNAPDDTGDGEKRNAREREGGRTAGNSPCGDNKAEESPWVEIKRRGDERAERNSSLGDAIPEGRDTIGQDVAIPVAVSKRDPGLPPERDGIEHGTGQNNAPPLPERDLRSDPVDTIIRSISSPPGPQPESPFLNPNNASASIADDPKPGGLSERTEALERDLSAANDLLERERLTHAKALREQKEKYENLIQALQLRLYISENKLRTYEEALEGHVQAVSAVCSSGKASAKRSEEAERIPGSPSLISRVLEHNKKGNGKAGDRIW